MELFFCSQYIGIQILQKGHVKQSMKCFLNVFKADWKRFWNIAWKLYIALAVYCILQALLFCSDMIKFIDKGRIASVSLGECLMNFFKGAKEFYPESNSPMDIPVFEIFVLLYLLFIIAYYVNSDRSALGRSIMIASKSPVYWWVSKYIIILCAVFMYIIIIVVTHMMCGLIVLGNRFKLGISFTSEQNIKLLLGNDNIKCDTNVVLLIILCLLCLITASAIILLMSYITNSIFGFILNLILFIVSICYMKWFCFYNYMMMYRIPHVYNQWYLGAGLMIIINVVIMLIGIIYSKRKDFL